MIEVTGDLWQLGVTMDAICITTNGTRKRNGAGVMGRGCAKEALERIPRIDRMLGLHLQMFGNVVGLLTLSPAIVAFPVKDSWDRPASLSLIEESVHQLIALTKSLNWKAVILPRPGCGNGGRIWDEVKPLLVPLDDRFYVVTK